MCGDLERIKHILIITRRLVILAVVILLIISTLLYITYYSSNRLMLTLLSFGCGLIGGFVSIKQRLNKIEDNELFLLSNSWFSVVLIPVYGGIFALVLYVLFLSGLLSGSMFPEFYIPPFGPHPTNADVANVLTSTNPKTGVDLPKLIFWSFVAGFSERMVPQIIQSVTSQYGDEQKLKPTGKNDSPKEDQER